MVEYSNYAGNFPDSGRWELADRSTLTIKIILCSHRVFYVDII